MSEQKGNYWDFIMKYLPGYDSDDRVLMSDILFRYIADEEVSISDIEYIKREYNGRTGVIEALKRIDLELLKESMEVFYEQVIRAKEGGSVARKTILEAKGDETNIIYRVDKVTMNHIVKYNVRDNMTQRMEYLRKVGAELKYYGMTNKTLRANMMMLDMGLDKIIGEMLLVHYRQGKSKIKDIVKVLTESDTLGIMRGVDQPMYEYKVGRFISSLVRGLKTDLPWDGKDITGDTIVIEADNGKRVVMSQLDWDKYIDFIMSNSYIVMPDPKVHHFGVMYFEGGEVYMKLNFQIEIRIP